MTTDELVSIMRFVLDEASREALETAEQGPKNIAKAVEEMSKSQAKAEKTGKETNRATGEFNKVFKTSNNILNKTSGVISSVTSALKTFGIVSMVASGGMAALSVNAGKSAKDVSNLSHSLQLSEEQVQTMGSVYERLGGSMQSFVHDALTFRAQTGRSFTSDEIKKLHDAVKGMSESDALTRLRDVAGLTDDGARIIYRYGDSFAHFAEEAQKMGHALTGEQLEKLKEFNSSWENFSNTLSGVSSAFQAGIADGLTPTLDLITEAFARNKEQMESWGKGIGAAIAGVTEGAVASIERLNKLLDKERTPKAIAVMTSPDPGKRKENIARLEKERSRRTTGNNVNFGLNLLKSTYREDISLSDVVDNYIAAQEIIDNPLSMALHLDQVAERGRDSFARDSLHRSIVEQMSMSQMYGPDRANKGSWEQMENRARELADAIIDQKAFPAWLSSTRESRRRLIASTYKNGFSGRVEDSLSEAEVQQDGRYGVEARLQTIINGRRHQLPPGARAWIRNTPASGDAGNTANTQQSNSVTIEKVEIHVATPEQAARVISHPQLDAAIARGRGYR